MKLYFNPNIKATANRKNLKGRYRNYRTKVLNATAHGKPTYLLSFDLWSDPFSGFLKAAA